MQNDMITTNTNNLKKKQKLTPKTLGIAVIGCGYWGKHYVRITNQLRDVNCVVVCDQSLEALEKIKKQYVNIETTTSVESVCKNNNVDAVIIVVPATYHKLVTIQCLKAGKHVLVEKPLTTNVQDGEEVVTLAKQMNKKLLVGHTFLYNDRVKMVKEILEKKTLGPIHTMYAQRTNLGPVRNDTSVLWDLAPHDISIFQYLTNGVLPTKVSANGSCILPSSKHVDVAFITLYYPNNLIGNIHVSWLDPHKVRTVTLVTNKARLLIDDVNNTEPVRIFYKQSVDDVENDMMKSSSTTTAIPSVPYSFRDGEISSPPVKQSEPLTNQVLDYIDCCLNNMKQPISDGKLGLDVVKILSAAEESIKNFGASVEL